MTTEAKFKVGDMVAQDFATKTIVFPVTDVICNDGEFFYSYERQKNYLHEKMIRAATPEEL
jgi:hypothetical protein